MTKYFLTGLFIFVFGSVCFAQTAGKITGRITYGDNTPLHNVHVEISQTKQSAETDENGNYEIAGVAPGTYTLLVHLEGFSDASRVVTVGTGADLSADFKLQITSLKE